MSSDSVVATSRFRNMWGLETILVAGSTQQFDWRMRRQQCAGVATQRFSRAPG